MKTRTVTIENITFDELAAGIAGMLRQPVPAGCEDFENIVPWLTKEQAAIALRASTVFIDNLVKAADLRPYWPDKRRPRTIRFKTSDVLRLRASGKTGRK